MKSRILAIAGNKQSGKTTCSNFLHGYQLRCHAIIENFKITEDGQLIVTTHILNENGQEEKADAMLDVNRKDLSFAEWAIYSMWPFVKSYSFSSPLKEIATGLFGLTEEQCHGTDKQKNTTTNIRWGDLPGANASKKNKRKRLTAREFLQYFGTDICRSIYSDVWAERCIKDINNEDPLLAIIDDCRFPNEAEAVQKAGGKVIRLTRSDHKDPHSSESALEEWDDYDAVIDNQNLTIAETVKRVIGVLDEWGWLGKEIAKQEIKQRLAEQLSQSEPAQKPELVGGIHTIKKDA